MGLVFGKSKGEVRVEEGGGVRGEIGSRVEVVGVFGWGC